jgi:alpha-mannosidase
MGAWRKPKVDRREFVKRLGLGTAILHSRSAFAQVQDQGPTPTLYYVDGYHGGVRGHMPAGCWRDILNSLRVLPDWKLSLDVEAASWDVLRREDPEAYGELKAYLDSQPLDARVEMVGDTFCQPYGWAVGGESNIRQLIRGREIIRAHFPKAALQTYAVQEPCWSSCLPQILLSLGFTGAVLKDPSTAWGGYSAGFNADLVNWVGPDGSAIPTVPRYACEHLLEVWETESVEGTPEFSRKCAANGIPHPAGMCFQDLGWHAGPNVSGKHIRYVTWREYIHTIADQPTQRWHFTMEDILVTLPWGEQTLQAVAQQVRAAENRLLMCEKVAALAWLEQGVPWPGTALQEAWESLFWTEHHDAWITATTREGRQAWAFQVASNSLDAELAANSIIAASAELISRGFGGQVEKPLGSQWVRVINTLGIERNDLAELTLALDRGTYGIRVFDSMGAEIPCQVIETRSYDSEQPADGADSARSQGGRLNTATVLFRPRVPALGYATCRVEPIRIAAPGTRQGNVSAQTEKDGGVVMESDLYHLRFDPLRGGTITSLYAKQVGKEFCQRSSQYSFNEYRGYFIDQKKWRSSSAEPADITIMESGPLRARVRVNSRVGGCPCETIVTLTEGQRRIDFRARFVFEQETWIGDPWDIKPEARMSERRRSQNDGRWKLQALFPVSLGNQAIYKNAAYDVCRSRNADTVFQRWDEIKHNIILHWVDVADESQKEGLAIFSDHTTAYTYGPEHPLSLVMGWGWEGGFWWGKRPLQGVHQVSYSVVPHAGLWDEGRISEENSRWNEPLLTQIMDGQPPKGSETRSLVSVSGGGVEVPTLLVEGNHMFIRLFNSEGSASRRLVSMRSKPVQVDLVELDGRIIEKLQAERASDGRYEITIALPRFGIRTLRCQMTASG